MSRIDDHEAWADLGCRELWTKLRADKRGVVSREAAMTAIRAAYETGYIDALIESPEPIIADALEHRDALWSRLPVL